MTGPKPIRSVVAVAQAIHPDAMTQLTAAADVLRPQQWPDSLASADAAIVRNAKVDAAMLEGAAKLKIIARVGVGTDTIDLDAATAQGIAVTITPEANSVAVAEHVFALILAVSKRIVAGNGMVRAGRFADRDGLSGRTLAGQTLGVVGLGRIGKRVAKLAHAFDMSCLIFDPFAGADAAAFGDVVSDMKALLTRADIVTLHAPLTPTTRQMIGKAELQAMKPGALLINAARAPLIDAHALADALNSGHLGGAAIDVYDGLPTKDHPLVATPALLTPHVAALTQEAFAGMSLDAVKAVLAYAAGENVPHIINPQEAAT